MSAGAQRAHPVQRTYPAQRADPVRAEGRRDPEASRWTWPPGAREALIALDGAMGRNALGGAGAPAPSAGAAVVRPGCIGAQVAAIGYRSPLQPVVAAWGAVARVSSMRLRSAEGRQTALRVTGWPQRRTPASPRAAADRASES
jgi:hypothetical protein